MQVYTEMAILCVRVPFVQRWPNVSVKCGLVHQILRTAHLHGWRSGVKAEGSFGWMIMRLV